MDMYYPCPMNLKHLTDKTLLADTKRLAQKEREITLEMLHHLKEIERRKLFSDLKYSSLFDYAVKELGYSGSAAYRRIESARLLKDVPSIERKVINGELTLSTLAQAGQLFRNEDITEIEKKKEILAEIENKSSRDCEKILMNFKTEPQLPSERAKRVTPQFTTVKFNFSDDTMKVFNEVKDHFSNKRFNNDQLFQFIFQQVLKKKEVKSLPTSVSPGVNRHIPISIKRLVFERDKGQCTKCGSRKFLQYDHITPYSMGGKSTVENLRLLCASCNQRSGITRGIINKAK